MESEKEAFFSELYIVQNVKGALKLNWYRPKRQPKEVIRFPLMHLNLSLVNSCSQRSLKRLISDRIF